MTRTHLIVASALALATAGCMTPGTQTAQPGDDDDHGAGATLTNAGGEQVAIMEAGEQGGALYVVIDATGMAPGRYAAHIHAAGRCDAPGFESAGPHWNPARRSHGLDADNGPHMGDLPNIAINSRGRGTVAFQIQNTTLQGGPNALLDADGAAVVIHADEDDFQTDPSGNSGPRIACGVIRRAG